MFWRKIGVSYFLLSTMNISDLMLLSFRDANQDPSPASGLNAFPASTDSVTMPSEDTPIRQRCLFPETSHCKSDNDDNEEVEDTNQSNGSAEFKISPWT
jgi:hypothetical protein